MSKTKGRPKKFTTTELIEIIELYIQKNKRRPIRLSASKLATYSTNELGKKAHYQDFTRNEEVKNFIEDFNKSLIQTVTATSDTFEIPIYEKLNVEKFLLKNNSKEKLQKALLRMDTLREKVHDSYGKLQDKYVTEMEKKHELEAKIKQIEKELQEIKNEKNQVVKEWKQRFKNSEEKNRILRAKNKILESFLKQHHYETMAEYSLYLEGIITSGVEIEHPEMIRVEDYKSGNYDLSDVIKAYNAITSDINGELDLEEAYDDDEYLEFDEDLADEEEALHDVNEEDRSSSEASQEGSKETRQKQLEDDIFGPMK